jgi:dihydropteroate synthase
MYNLIKFKHKHDARQQMSGQYSSIYKLNNYYYIVTYSDTSSVNNLSADEYELYQWGCAEISNSPAFIVYETNSALSENGRSRTTDTGATIYRTFEYLTEIFGILNYTPDSFSDGGLYNTPDAAINQINHLLDGGCEIIDIGVESTRPGASVITAEAEISCLTNLLAAIRDIPRRFKLSIDTYHIDTVKWLINQDVHYINDVSGSLPLSLVGECINSGKSYIAMHSLSVPASKELILPLTTNPVEYLGQWIDNKIRTLQDYNINLDKVIFDPGIGFGNNSPQSWYIIRNISKLCRPGVELLLGHSRKSFIGHINFKDSANRDLESGLIAASIASQVDYLRLHDVSYLNSVYPVYSSIIPHK